MGGPGSGPRDGARCRACAHPKRRELDEDLCYDPNVRRTALEYGLTKGCVEYHYLNHMGSLTPEERTMARLAAGARHLAITHAMAPELEAKRVAAEKEREEQNRILRLEAEQLRQDRKGVLDTWRQIETANRMVWDVLKDLKDVKPEGEDRLQRHDRTLKAIQRVEGQLELQAKLLGEIETGTKVAMNVLVLPETKAHLDRVASAFEACAAAGCTRCADAWEARR